MLTSFDSGVSGNHNTNFERPQLLHSAVFQGFRLTPRLGLEPKTYGLTERILKFCLVSLSNYKTREKPANIGISRMKTTLSS